MALLIRWQTLLLHIRFLAQEIRFLCWAPLNTSIAPLPWPVSENASYIFRRHCTGAVYSRTDCSIDVHGNAYFDANIAGHDGGMVFFGRARRWRG